MENNVFTRQNLLGNLKYLPPNKLQEVDDFVQFLLFQNKTKIKEENDSFAGIWANIGFEKIVDLDTEINSIRKELSDNILNKQL